MMSTHATASELSGLLPQILGGLDESGILESAESGEFVQSLADQIKLLMVQHGDDPIEVAAIDDEALVAQFFALIQGQSEPLAGGLSVTTGLGGLMGGAMTPSGSDEEDTVTVEEPSDELSESESDATVRLAALPNVILERLSESGRILPTGAKTSELLGNQLTSEPVDVETLTRALLRQVNPSTVPDGEVPEMASSLESTPVDLETLTRALLRQANPPTVPYSEMPEMASSLESTPVDLETLTRALLRQANPPTVP
ncbi:hypothetical protein, partial [Allochromatium palmeri]